MSTVQPATDLIVVNRGGVDYRTTLDKMSTLQDTDLLLVNRGGIDYRCTAADIKSTLGGATPVSGVFTSGNFTNPSRDFNAANAFISTSPNWTPFPHPDGVTPNKYIYTAALQAAAAVYGTYTAATSGYIRFVVAAAYSGTAAYGTLTLYAGSRSYEVSAPKQSFPTSFGVYMIPVVQTDGTFGVSPGSGTSFQLCWIGT